MDALTNLMTEISLQDSYNFRKRKSTSPSSCLGTEGSSTTKVVRECDEIIFRRARRKACRKEIFENNTKLLCKILKHMPLNSLATVSKKFCDASYLRYREALSTGQCFIRSWMDSGLDLKNIFFSNLHFHEKLLSCPYNRNVGEVRTVLTFATESSLEIIYPMKLPTCVMMGITDVVFNGVRFVEKDACFVSLFIPETKHIVTTTFGIPICYTEHDDNFLRDMISAVKRELTELKAIFWLQCNSSLVFTINSFPLNRDTLLCAGIMSVANTNGVDTDIAFGLAIYGDNETQAHLYDIDTNDEKQVIDWILKMKNDIPYDKKGFCIFVFSSSRPTLKANVSSWESDSEEEETQCYSMEEIINYDSFIQILQQLKLSFPNIKVIGSKSPIIYSQGSQNTNTANSYNASFLMITYPD